MYKISCQAYSAGLCFVPNGFYDFIFKYLLFSSALEIIMQGSITAITCKSIRHLVYHRLCNLCYCQVLYYDCSCKDLSHWMEIWCE